MKKIFTAMLVVALGITLPASPSIATSVPVTPTTIVAHRAGPLDAPENTAQAITTAKQKNSNLKWVELDVRWNKSDFPILMHDPTVDRTTNGTGNLKDIWFADAMKLNAADFSPWNGKNSDGSWKYPQYHGTTTAADGTVRDIIHPAYGWEFVYAAYKANVNILMDVKDIPTKAQADKLYGYLSDPAFNGYENRVIYMGSPDGVKTMKSFYPDLDYMILEYPADGMMRTAESIKSYGAEGYAVPYTSITKTFVDYYHANAIKVFSWTTDSTAVDVTANWDKVVNAGTDALITNQHVAAGAKY